MKIAGIDLSLTSPSICVFDGDVFSFEQCKFYYLTGSKKSVIENGMLQGKLWPEYSEDPQRYDIVSKWALDVLKPLDITKAYLEGYAFNAVGRVFQIAENTGILKYKMWQEGISCNVVPPTVIKKFATDKGNANKELLEKKFEEETCIGLRDTLKLTSKQWNPSSDIIDSYFICKYGVNHGKEKQ